MNARQDSPDPWLLDAVTARLAEAARTGEPLDLVLSVRGRVWPVPGKNRGRWRMRTPRGWVVTFRPEFVIALNWNGNGSKAKPPAARPGQHSGGAGDHDPLP